MYTRGLQRRVIRIIARVNRRANTDIYYEKFQILNVKQINICMWYVYLCIISIITYFPRYLIIISHWTEMIMHMTHGSVSYYMYPPVPLTWQREVWNIGESKFGINFLDIDVSQPVFKHNFKRIIFAGHLDYLWANLKCCYGMKSVYNVL